MADSAFQKFSPSSKTGANMSAIQDGILDSFERDIEDAVFETIKSDVGAREATNRQHQIKQRHKSIFKDKIPANQSTQEKAGLGIFSKKPVENERKPIFSQTFLALSVCAFTMAVVLPVVWWISGDSETDMLAPDRASITASVPAPENSSESNIGSQLANPVILDEPSSIESVINDNMPKEMEMESSSVGSIVYFGAK